MNSLFKTKSKPSSVAKDFETSLKKIMSKPDPKSAEKHISNVTKEVSTLKVMLYGDTDTQPTPEALPQITNELVTNNAISVMISAMDFLEFEV